MPRNDRLQNRMTQDGLTQGELADRVNRRLLARGRRASITDRTVRYWLTGKTMWPQEHVRDALQAEFDCPIEQLGFARPSWARPAQPKDDPVHRRTFLAAAGVAVLPLPTLSRPRVGYADVDLMRDNLDKLTALDDRRGGHGALEHAAVAGADRILELSQGASSSRVNRRLLALAADHMALAAWSCIDARHLERAQTHLDRGAALSGVAGDPVVSLRVWNFMAMLAHHRGRPLDAIAAARAAQNALACRRDPLYASLAHARAAIGHADQMDRQAALRSLGHAEDALSRAETRPRPAWVAFYDAAELHALTAIVCQQLGEFDQSEAASHRALAQIPDQFRRNRAQATVRLALAQVGQGDAEQSCATAHAVLDLMAGDSLPGRMRTLLGDFHRSLLILAPNATATTQWADRARSEWSRTT